MTTKSDSFQPAVASNENYFHTRPFTRGAHQRLGVGFTYESLQAVADIQLPLTINTVNTQARKNLSAYFREISLLDKSGISITRIAEIFGVNRSTIKRLLGQDTPF